ncbi:MAG: hypothetical protein CMH81_01455 [Nitrospiraceae bacterium]|nr:hypothetical protein [Nitrospiraceae bacterium]
MKFCIAIIGLHGVQSIWVLATKAYLCLLWWGSSHCAVWIIGQAVDFQKQERLAHEGVFHRYPCGDRSWQFDVLPLIHQSSGDVQIELI